MTQTAPIAPTPAAPPPAAKAKTPGSGLSKFLRPNVKITAPIERNLIAGWLAFMLVFWFLMPHLNPLLPGPVETAGALQTQYQQGALSELITSLVVSLEAITVAAILGLGLVYLATIPLFHILVDWIGKLRFLSLAGIIVLFEFAAPNGHILKVMVLAFLVLTFFVTDMLQVVDDIPRSRFDYARTQGLNEWQVLREVVIRGTLAQAFESIRMNAAMAWMMLSMVEGLSRSEGGIGIILLNMQTHMNFDALLALQIVIFLVGIAQDRVIKFIKIAICPYAKDR